MDFSERIQEFCMFAGVQVMPEHNWTVKLESSSQYTCSGLTGRGGGRPVGGDASLSGELMEARILDGLIQ